MVHILASLAFALVALASIGLIVLMLAQDGDKVMTALGLDRDPAPRESGRRIRVRAAGRWQAASATVARPWRAAA